ncbi:hypothetical protein ASC80_12210 [Afipia sp. Root123D2]|uniref:hypothetical protein n=1 Tax=Afipia sp. Root123D2 TaxID=1736436 RepID=UPI0006F4C3A9|nr:hypothetical protein [Afipia sp. Root123D2]KQW20924.1 hypothetical protein ASC80_12210 [Afipia sp. Root123D2]
MTRLVLAAAMLCAPFAMAAEARTKHRTKTPAVECFVFCPVAPATSAKMHMFDPADWRGFLFQWLFG